MKTLRRLISGFLAVTVTLMSISDTVIALSAEADNVPEPETAAETEIHEYKGADIVWSLEEEISGENDDSEADEPEFISGEENYADGETGSDEEEPVIAPYSEEDFTIEGTVLKSYTGSDTVVTVPDGVTEIGRSAFANKKNITKVVLPESIIAIKESAFSYCTSLVDIVLPSSIESLAHRAFYHCESLEKINIPASLKKIELNYENNRMAFAACPSLKTFILDENITKIIAGLFSGSSIESIEIPDGITSIGASAFYNCGNLKSVKLPESLTEIGGNAFSVCGSLSDIDLSHVKSIGQSAFSYCEALTDIDISSLESMGGGVFYRCYGLSYVKIPATLTNCANFPFNGCVNLTTVEFEDGCTTVFDEMFYDYAGYGNYVGLGLQNIILPDTITAIGYRAFEYCMNLESIDLPDSLISIGGDAFIKTGLTSLTIPDSVTSVGTNIIQSCSSLTTIRLPAKLQYLPQIFNECPGIQDIYLGAYITGGNIGGFQRINNSSATVHCAPNTLTEITLLNNGIFFVSDLETDQEVETVIDKEKSYYAVSGSLSGEGNVLATVSYSIKDFASLSDVSVTVKFPTNAGLLNETIYTDDGSMKVSLDSTGRITVPVSSAEGKFSFYIGRSDGGEIMSYAVLNYKKDGVSKLDIIDVLTEKLTSVSIDVPSRTSKNNFNFNGYAAAEANVDIYVDDVLAASVKAVYAVARTAPARTSDRTLPHFEPHFAGH